MKRIICLVLAVVMLSGLACTAVGAEETEQKTYNYVALGDSIAAGFGLENETGAFIDDPSIFLTEELLADPIRGAYPALFGEKLAAFGEENGFEVNAANLSTAGYLADDVAMTILEEGHVGKMMKDVLYLMGLTENDPMDKYHEIFSRYLPDADLVSVHLGGNDIIRSVINSLGSAENPILQAVSTSVTLSLAGTDIRTSINTGVQIIKAKQSSITYKTVMEAVAAIRAVVAGLDETIDKAAQDVGSIVDAVRTVNEDADLALINMYDPYGNSLEFNGKTQNIKTIVCDIFARSAEYICGLDGGADRETVVAGLKSIVKDELSYPLQYLLAGKTMDKVTRKFNSRLYDVAESKGAIYVDIYHISNECNFDPHPEAQGHEEIAFELYDSTYRTAAEKMGIEIEEEISGDADGDGVVSILDVTCIQRLLAGVCDKDGSAFSGRILTALEKKVLDVDGDGEVTIQDATAIQCHLAGYHYLPECRKVGHIV